MTQRVSIVMYHYVRELDHSRYPAIKGLAPKFFCEQLRYIQKHYTVIRMEDMISAVTEREAPPPNALLLTIDDAYLDHFTCVFPILDELKLQGSFFPSARAVAEHKVLDVNKIHFILASARDKHELLREIFALLDQQRDAFGL